MDWLAEGGGRPAALTRGLTLRRSAATGARPSTALPIHGQRLQEAKRAIHLPAEPYLQEQGHRPVEGLTGLWELPLRLQEFNIS